jgi:hypothetical protein
MHTIRIERLKSLIVDNPNDTFALFALAKEYEKVGELENAVQLFEKLLVVDEKYIGAYYHLAKVYEQLDEVKKALNIYEKGVMFLFWIITIISKRIIAPNEEDLTLDRVISIMGAGLVGSLACSFMDTMWFSAVEGEVYASSMFFISITFWAVMKWDEQADEPHANRWLVFACFMIGLSLGVHLLSLLVIPAAALVYYFRRYEPTILGFFVAFFVGFVILGLVQVGVVQFVPKIASYFEMFFVNTLRLPFNSGLAFGGILLFVLTILLLRYANKIKHADLQLTAICALVIFVGFSSYIMVPIRAVANPPINMNAPKDAFSLISYLNREQYGDRPLVERDQCSRHNLMN